jgi:hypothetical protein
MAREDKPYRVYRGGRVKGKVPNPLARPARKQRAGSSDRAEQHADYARLAGADGSRWSLCSWWC